MFPYSSSSNTTNCDYQLPFPSCDSNNQTQLLDYGNPYSILSSHAHHIHQQYSSDHDHLPPANFLEHDGLLLSYLLSHQQLSLTNTNNNNPTLHHLQPHHPHDTAQISVAGSNSNNSSMEKEETIVPINVPDAAPSKGSSSCSKEETILPINVPNAAPSKGSSSCSKVKTNNTMIVNNGEQAEKKAKGPPRKRSSGKNDRHSKIYTAQGPRDRRMRLSLQIARKFFDLQDMLGFDKASKTIDWLFTKSKSSIKELKQGFLSSPSSSSAAAAAVDYSCTTNPSTNNSESNSEATNADSWAVGAGPPVEKKTRKLCVVAKESRVEARARARERTREKMMHTWTKSGFDNIDHQELLNPNDDLGGQPYLSWPSNCPINNPGILMNFMMKGTNHQVEAKSEDYTTPTSSLNFGYSSISSGHGANSEDYAFPGFSGNHQY